MGRPAYCYVLFQERAAKWLVLRCCPARNGAGAKPSGYSPVQSTSLRDASCTGGTLPRTVLSRSAGMPEGTRCQNFLWKFCKDAVPSSRHCADVHRTSASDCSSPFLRKKSDTHLGIRLFGTPEGTRTPNPRNRNPMLYPLSHWRICFSLAIIAVFSPFVKGFLKIISSPVENGCFLSPFLL